MACFLGCFGFPSKRKRRKPAIRILPGDRNLVCYEPLESAASAEFNSSDWKSTSSKAKEQPSSVKIRKKVSFNLDVQTYEPIQVQETAVYHLLDNTTHQGKEEDSGNKREGKSSHSSTSNYYPSNYRYLNCRDSYDDEEEIADDESELEFDTDYYYDDDDSDADESRVIDKERSIDPSETKTRGSADKPLINVNQEVGGGCTTNARIRGQCPTSVLNPIENTTQWRAMKASAQHLSKYRRKENIEVEQQVMQPFNSVPPCNQQMRPSLQDIPVNASLSNWLGSPSTRTINSNIAKNNKLQKKSIP